MRFLKFIKETPKYSKYSDLINDIEYIKKHDSLRDKYFLPIKNIEYYTDEILKNNFKRCSNIVISKLIIKDNDLLLIDL